MALDSYDNLKTAILDHLEQADLSAHVDDFIDIAEARHKREVRIREMLSRATLAIADGDRYVSLPADFLAMKYLRILNPETGSIHRYLPRPRQITEDEMAAKSTNCERAPKYYAIHEQIEFDSEADQAYTGEIFYYTELTALSDANATNDLLDRAPDVYLYAALSASAPFLLNDERIPMWESLYRSARDSLNLSQKQAIKSGPQVPIAAGV